MICGHGHEQKFKYPYPWDSKIIQMPYPWAKAIDQNPALCVRLNILKVGAFLMSMGNEFHILGPWNNIENFLIFVLQV